MFQGKNWRYRTHQKVHSYTEFGLSVEVSLDDGPWIKVLECGWAAMTIFQNNGIDPCRYRVAAFGLGLDRCVMALKGIDDIRLLRYPSSQIQEKMLDLTFYREQTKHPKIFTEQHLPLIQKRFFLEIFEDLRLSKPSISDLIFNIHTFQQQGRLKLTIEWQPPVKNINPEEVQEGKEYISCKANNLLEETWKA